MNATNHTNQQLNAIDREWKDESARTRNQNPSYLPDGIVAGNLAAMRPNDAAEIDPSGCKWNWMQNIACETIDARYPGADYFGRVGLAMMVATQLAQQASGLYCEQLFAVPQLTEEMRQTLTTRATAILNTLVS